MVEKEDDHIIHGLWIGSELSPLELLTLHSFTRHGHAFHLWVYEQPTNKLPVGVILQDANSIIPSNEVYCRKYEDPKHKIGKGSFGSPFSDLFRYKLLYDKGGWWVDMDVTCLLPFNFSDPYVFQSHPILTMIGNVMKAPKGCPLMQAAYQQVRAECDENTTDWLLPNKILNHYIKELGLSEFIRQDLGSSDWWPSVSPFILESKTLPESWYCIHWMNEIWRTQNINKSDAVKSSAYDLLLTEYNIPHQRINKMSWWKNKVLRLRNGLHSFLHATT